MTMTDEELAPILQTCLEQLASGATIETCLTAFPDQQPDLEPLLRAAMSVASLPRPALAAAAHTAIEQRILAQVALRRMPPSDPPNPSPPPAPAPPPTPAFFGLPIWVVSIIVFGLGLLLIIALLLAPLFMPAPLPSTPGPIVATAQRTQVLATATLPTPVPTAFLHSNSTAQPVTTAETIVQRRPVPTVETIVIIPPATARPAAPVNPPAAPPPPPGDDQSNDKDCQGRQIGRDDKKCTPDKPDKPDKPDNDDDDDDDDD